MLRIERQCALQLMFCPPKLPLIDQNRSQIAARLDVVRLDPKCLFQGLLGCLGIALLAQDRSQPAVAFAKGRIELNCALKMRLGFALPIDPLLQHREIVMREREKLVLFDRGAELIQGGHGFTA